MSRPSAVVCLLTLLTVLSACSSTTATPPPAPSSAAAASAPASPAAAASAQLSSASPAASAAAAASVAADAAGTRVAPSVSAAAVVSAAPAATSPTTAQNAPALPIPRTARLPYLLGTRSTDGRPTATYWQNTSQHTMRISVTPPSRTITATQEITYTNNSPYPLPVLIFRSYFNVHHPEAVRDRSFAPLEEFYSDGLQIDEFQVNGEVAEWGGSPSSTLWPYRFDQPLQPGSSVTFAMRWHYDLADANGWKEGAVDDTSFYLAYFYPRITVFDDTGAFDQTPFLGSSEFYDDFNSYRFAITVPRNYLVWATGDLRNPDEVLQPTYAQRLADSLTSDDVIAIATDDELTAGQVTAQTDTVTWNWQADNVRDIAIGLSDHYNWDAGSVVVDAASGRRAGVHAAYPDSAPLFTTMVEDGKTALTFGSTKWPGVPYPYSKTSIFVGGADEEYPMMVNDSAEPPPGMTVGLIAGHEILHSWFPFYMGTDERRYPFMDEGWTTNNDYLLAIDVLGQEGADAYFQTYRGGANLDAGTDLPIVVPQDDLRNGTSAFSNNQYGKAALGYLALRDLMGDAAFKASLHEFIARWNGKHTLPWDMFNTFNDTSSEDLTWFFENWFFSSGYIDIGVQDVTATDSGQAIAVTNSGGLAIPFDAVVTYTDGTTDTQHVTPAVWSESPQTAKLTLDGTKDVAAVTLETGIYPDANPRDNAWQPVAASPSASGAGAP